MIQPIRLSLFTILSMTLGLTACCSKPDQYHVLATQSLCEAGFDAWDQPTCSAEMKAAGSTQFILYPAENRAEAKQVIKNAFAKQPFLEQLTQCQIQDAVNWSCEINEQYFFKVKNGHYHHYTLNKDLTLSHFIGSVTEVNDTQ